MSRSEQQLGFCTWNVCDNTLFGDDVFAKIYGLTIERAATGVPIEEVINKMIAGDRERVAKEVHDAILSGDPYSTVFTVFVEGHLRTIDYTGRCLRDADGMPSFFSGTLCEQATSVLLHCRAALGLAQRQNNDIATHHLTNALSALAGERLQ